MTKYEAGGSWDARGEHGRAKTTEEAGDRGAAFNLAKRLHLQTVNGEMVWFHGGVEQAKVGPRIHTKRADEHTSTPPNTHTDARITPSRKSHTKRKNARARARARLVWHGRVKVVVLGGRRG